MRFECGGEAPNQRLEGLKIRTRQICEGSCLALDDWMKRGDGEMLVNVCEV